MSGHSALGRGRARFRLLWLHCWTLCALAGAPLIDLVRRHPEFLIANDFGRGRLAVLLLVLLVVAPLLLVLLALAARSSTARWPAWLPAVPSLGLGLMLGRRLGLGMTSLLLAAAAAAAIAWAYDRWPAVRRYFAWLGLAALAAPAQLMLDPAVQRLTDRDSVATASGEGSGPPVVILLLDELPVTTLLDSAGRLDRRRFPHLAALADRAHWYDNVLSVDPATEKAVPALLTGAVIPDGKLPIARDLPDSLFTLLAPRYRIAAVESVSRLCPPSLNRLANDRRLLGDGSWLLDIGVLALHLWTPEPWADRWLPPINAAWRGFAGGREAPGGGGSPRRPWWQRLLRARPQRDANDKVAQFRRFLAAIDGRSGGTLYFAHLMLPHRPWIYMPSGEVYLADSYREIRDFLREEWPANPALAAQAYQRHLLQAEFTDTLIGELTARLEELGLFDAALIAIAADHGISFRPGEKVRKNSATNREDLLQVPLLLKLPGQRAAVYHPERRSTLDLLPTVLATLGLEPPSSVTGRSLLAAPASVERPSSWGGLIYRRSLFGDLDEPEELFRYGRFEAWFGREIEAAGLEQHPEIVVSLLGAGAHRAYRADDATIPAWVFGYIESPEDIEGFGIAVTVDGVVAATGEVQLVEGRFRFNALLPPSALPPGEHHVEILLIEPRSGTIWRPSV